MLRPLLPYGAYFRLESQRGGWGYHVVHVTPRPQELGRGRAQLQPLDVDGRMHRSVPVLNTEHAELACRDEPTVGTSLGGVVVVPPHLGRRQVAALVPGIHRRAHGGVVVVVERHEDVRVVMARRAVPTRPTHRVP